MRDHPDDSYGERERPAGADHAAAPKHGLTRRRLLLGAAGGVAGLGLLGAGVFYVTDRAKRFGRDAERVIPDHSVALPASAPRMVIARGVDPASNVRAAVERLGGITQLVTPADVVVIKPNIGWDRTPEQGANTHPEVVAEVVRLCRAARARRVIVSDCPVRRSRDAFERSGILAAAAAAGAEVIVPEESRYHTVEISQRLGTWDVLEPFVIATKVINVPVAKHHELTGVTCGLKNWIGITGKLRIMFHDDLQRSIAELAALMRPTLTIVDASRVLMEHGPAGGGSIGYCQLRRTWHLSNSATRVPGTSTSAALDGNYWNRRTATPAASSAARTAAAISRAPGLSPCTQIVSAEIRTFSPVRATAIPVAAIDTACSAACRGSVIREPGSFRDVSIPSAS